MSEKTDPRQCPDCDRSLDRRQFLATTTAAAVATSASSLLTGEILQAAPKPSSAAEGIVREFYATLSDEQKKEVALPWEDSRFELLDDHLPPKWVSSLLDWFGGKE